MTALAAVSSGGTEVKINGHDYLDDSSWLSVGVRVDGVGKGICFSVTATRWSTGSGSRTRPPWPPRMRSRSSIPASMAPSRWPGDRLQGREPDATARHGRRAERIAGALLEVAKMARDHTS